MREIGASQTGLWVAGSINKRRLRAKRPSGRAACKAASRGGRAGGNSRCELGIKHHKRPALFVPAGIANELWPIDDDNVRRAALLIIGPVVTKAAASAAQILK